MKTPSKVSVSQRNKTTHKLNISAVLLSLFALPTLSFAYGQMVYDFGSLVGLFINMIKTLVPLVVGLTLLYFMWGIFQLVRSNSEDARKEAIGVITYGVVSLFVMVSVWGLVSILTSTFFGGGLVIPQLR